MHRDSDRHKQFSRRAAMLAGGQFVLLTALTGRLYYLQVVESEKYKNLADENRINFRLLAPPRGRITDRNGLPIADPERRRILRDVKRNRSFVPVTVRENLIWSQVSQIEVNTPDLPGVLIDVGESRYYPYGEDFAHVLGYVAAVSEGEITGDPLLELPGFRVGKVGIEKVHDLALRGTGGNSEVEVNAYGRIIRELSRKDGEPGAEVQLTIDMELQRLAVERIADESAAVVVMDIHNGEVLTLVSTPSFDPNKFNQGLSSAEWSNLVNNPKSPLTNKATRGQYAPGSTFKMIVALAALEHGIVTPETDFWCSGKMKLGNAVFHCWRKHGHGRVDCAEALTQSCDVYFYEVAKRLGITRISEMARRLGLGEPLGIDLPGEKGGLIPSPEWKLGAIGTSWQQGETVILGIGQGYILVTPLQLAVMTARLANGGIAVTPHLTRQVILPENTDAPPPITQFESLGLIPEHLDIVTNGMVQVVNDPHGTAFRARIKEKEMAMAGKSGTVQVRRISKAEREVGVKKNKDLEWKERDHALFVAYAPVDNPRYAISVVVEHGGGGSSVAAPIARDILHEVQKRKAATSLSTKSTSETPDEPGPDGQPETEQSNG